MIWPPRLRIGFAIVLSSAVLWAGDAGAQASEVATVRAAAGSATVLRTRAALRAAPGLSLRPSDVLTTGSDGRVSVTFIDRSRIALGPNSRLALTQFEFDSTTHKGRAVLTMDRGKLGVVSGQIAKENRDGYRVRTPTSLLAARGTRFVVEVR